MAGVLCGLAFPIPQRSYAGNPESSVAVCTLSSIHLLVDLAAMPPVMDRVSVLGRLLSENRGIDAMLRTLHARPGIGTVVMCGMDVAGHRAGHSLLMLHSNGIDSGGRICGSRSPEPYLRATREQVRHFCQDVQLVDMTGITDRTIIARQICRLG